LQAPLIWLVFLFGLAVTIHSRADDSGLTWSFTGSQSSLTVNLSAPNGTQAGVQGDQLALAVAATQATWDLYTCDQDSTQTMVQNYSTAVLPGGSLTWSVTSGDGTFVNSAPGVNSDGSAIAAIQMGSKPTDVTVNLSANGVQASESLHLTVADTVTWQYLRTEGVLNANLGTDPISGNIPLGESHTVQVHADYNTWEVWQGSNGQMITQNNQTGPASSASVAFSTSGDGSISGSAQLDQNGNGTAVFTMGSEQSIVQAVVSYFQTNNSTAWLEFDPAPPAPVPGPTTTPDPGTTGDPAPNWHYDHTEATIAAQVSGSTQLTAYVSYSSWEAWTDGLGNWNQLNPSSGPAYGASVSFGLQSGDGSFSSADSSTDPNGNASATFGGNTMASTVVVTASYLARSSTTSLYIAPGPPPVDPGTPPVDPGTPPVDPGTPPVDPGTPPVDPGTPPVDPGTPPVDPWVWSSNQGSISASPDGSVTYDTWEVWTNSATGEVSTRNTTSSPAIGGAVSWSVTSGDASVSSSGDLTPGSSNSTATETVTFAGYTTTINVDVPPAAPVDDTNAIEAARTAYLAWQGRQADLEAQYQAALAEESQAQADDDANSAAIASESDALIAAQAGVAEAEAAVSDAQEANDAAVEYAYPDLSGYAVALAGAKAVLAAVVAEIVDIGGIIYTLFEHREELISTGMDVHARSNGIQKMMQDNDRDLGSGHYVGPNNP